MADVVRLGRPPSKSAHNSYDKSYTNQDAVTMNSDHYSEKPSQAELHHDLRPQNASNVSGMIYKSDTTVGQNALLDEQPKVASLSSVLDASIVPDSDMYSNQSNFYDNGSDLSRNYDSENIQASEAHVTNENLTLDNTVSAYVSNGQKIITDVVGASHSNGIETGCGSNSSDRSYSAALTDNDVVAAKLQHLSLEKEDPENNSTVVLPSHLQALAADCSHLSFGTYKSGNDSASTGLLPSNQLKEDLQEATTTLDDFPAGLLETRYEGFHIISIYLSLCVMAASNTFFNAQEFRL